MNINFYNKLSFKLISVISTIILAFLAIHTYYTLNKLETDLTNISSQNAYNTSDIIKKSTRYSMLLNRSDDVHQIIKTVGTEAGVEKIRIYNKQGEIIFSTDSTEIARVIDKKEEACVACHNNGNTFLNLPEAHRKRFFTNRAGEKVMGLINPIYNEKDCSNNECHAHSADVKILGVLDVVVSMKKTQDIIDSNIRSIISISLLITIIISIFIWLYITMLVKNPIRKLTKGIEEL
ncbi:MAG: hypothetical protein ACM3RX_05630, partial [Methanococcaceae archaeon]